ncbi:acetyl-CoA carboxylase biotin carboxyl carrier protein subunit [Aequorivita viscosa]|uniref:Biotin carboxyl carrier protein n=1 Tax=Aequorivita viscosa TaxID=797419 RepID=A0A1M6GTR8_9FLAO|nr:acetyl-CoA carboxylase biotin carboxyl carrier protein subunit [Aequorivita viscosa]SDW78453.1 biotin carboxyl carrier protein [Aequorivita viscosa]SHJ13341.1 biotin carboxyl carrier protein [Aequorivita viscosa]
MKHQYSISVDENYQFELGVDDATKLNQLIFSEVEAGTKKEKIHILHNQKSFSAAIVKEDFLNRVYTVKVNGNSYTVNIATPLDRLIKEMGLSLGNASVEDEVLAPMPGIILEVTVATGDEVKQGDYLCVLEAMKMENALTAPRDGVIKSVYIAKGDTVDKGKLLIEFQKND